MIKPDFDKCTRVATNLLYRQNISNRILNIQNLLYDKNILFDSIQTYCLHTHTPINHFLSENKDVLRDGCTIYDRESNYYIILYNDEIKNFEHRNWTLAHEIGHIYLNHTKDDDLEEIEAHFFASQLFMPEYSLFMMAKEYGRISHYDLVEIFGVSESAAYKRLTTMKRKTMFSSSKQDKEIWEIQKERIDLYYECQKDGLNYRSYLSFWKNMKDDYEKEQHLIAYY